MDWKTFEKQHPLTPEDEAVQNMIIKIVIARRNQGLTQAQLASKIGMSQSQLAKIETFETIPKMNTLFKIIDGLGLSLSLTTSPKAKN